MYTYVLDILIVPKHVHIPTQYGLRTLCTYHSIPFPISIAV